MNLMKAIERKRIELYWEKSKFYSPRFFHKHWLPWRLYFVYDASDGIRYNVDVIDCVKNFPLGKISWWIQGMLYKRGIYWHNWYRDECTPGFECCRNSNTHGEQKRWRYLTLLKGGLKLGKP